MMVKIENYGPKYNVSKKKKKKIERSYYELFFLLTLIKNL